MGSRQEAWSAGWKKTREPGGWCGLHVRPAPGGLPWSDGGEGGGPALRPVLCGLLPGPRPILVFPSLRDRAGCSLQVVELGWTQAGTLREGVKGHLLGVGDH